jgi:hypothetical protein
MLTALLLLQLQLQLTAPTVCISAMDDKGAVTPVECQSLAPNTGNEPQTFAIPEGDRQ